MDEADLELLRTAPEFDAEWYLRTYPGMARPGADPAAHYLSLGAEMGRDPGPAFSGTGYLAANPDVAASGINPLLHFGRHGREEGRAAPEPGPTPVERALAASTRGPRRWGMTRGEAARVAALTLAPPATAPRRHLARFDTRAARRYLAAAETLYDAAAATTRVSVVMPTRDRAGRIERAVRSVLAQSHGALELLVVDDGSTDDTRARLARIDDPRLRVLSRAHAGVSAARNAGLDAATGEVIAYLDSDNAWTPDYLRLMLAGLLATGADCAYAASCLIDGAGRASGYRGEPFDWAACLERNYVDLNVFVHRAGLGAALGGFDESLRRTVDWDLILRYAKGRATAYLPFMGCAYHDDARDPARITNSAPRLYRRMVIEKARRGLGSGAEALESMPLSFGIKIAAPEAQSEEWGDFHYAASLARALERRGHGARIDFRGQWTRPESYADDVALVLRGKEGYAARPGQLTLGWVISHPDRIPYDEYGGYDAVMVASHSYAALLSAILDRAVLPVLQCTDTTRFHPPQDPPPQQGRGLFVGNSRNEYRQMVRWAVETGADIDIYGARWEAFLPPERIAARNLPNDRLGAAYGHAGFVLNDHWPSMRDFGLVSNRVFDVLASGGRLISDPMPAIEALFGGAVETVDGAAALGAVAARPPAPAARRRAVARQVAARHSFDARAGVIESVVHRTMLPGRDHPSVRPYPDGPPRRRLGLVAERARSGGWSRSAHIRLIGPLTTDRAHARGGIDILLLDGPDDPRAGSCDLCVVQNAAVPDPAAARRLTAMLARHGIPLHLDIDDACPHPAGPAMGHLMDAAREIRLASETLAARHARGAPDRAVLRPDTIDPRYWRDYRAAEGVDDRDGTLRLLCPAIATEAEDLPPVLAAVEAIARARPGRVELILLGFDAPPPRAAPWLRALPPPRGGYPALMRQMREIRADAGLAPAPGAVTDVAFLHAAAMGRLPIVSEAPGHLARIAEGCALGCAAGRGGWHETLSRVAAAPEAFEEIRRRAACHARELRDTMIVPDPLAERPAEGDG